METDWLFLLFITFTHHPDLYVLCCMRPRVSNSGTSCCWKSQSCWSANASTWWFSQLQSCRTNLSHGGKSLWWWMFLTNNQLYCWKNHLYQHNISTRIYPALQKIKTIKNKNGVFLVLNQGVLVMLCRLDRKYWYFWSKQFMF